MYHALIVDDEKHVRQTISLLGQWAENGICPPSEATDGHTALALMEQQPADLVLVDIKMPVMDGMEFLENATRRFPGAKYIIISGFNDFEYAKQAIRFHILDYLLKPISETELNACLEKAVRELQKERELSLENPLLDLMNRLVRQAAEGSLCAFLAVRTAGESPFFWNQENTRRLVSLAEGHLPFRGELLSCRESPHLLILGLHIPAERFPALMEPDRIKERLLRAAGQALTDFCESEGCAAVGGIGPLCCPALPSMRQSCQEAVRISSRIDLCADRPLLLAEMPKPEPASPDSLSAKKELLLRALGKWDEKYLEDILARHFDTPRKRGAVTAELLSRSAVELLLILQDFAREYQIPEYTELLSPLFEPDHLNQIGSIKEFCSFFRALFAALAARADRSTQPAIQKILPEIKAYMEQHYARNLTLTFFSDKYHMTKEYLSKQFKEQYGCGIYEYLLSFRMERAKLLLAESECKIQEISDQVGYTDTSYFSKAFKTYCGLSPREYRQQNAVRRP